jgi:predicted dehydrogenase
MRFGLIGSGYWATKVHAASLARADGVEFCSVWGRDARRTKELAERFGVRAQESLDSLLAQVDAVAIAVSPEAQPDLVVACARAGVAILMEKPLGLTMAAADLVHREVTRAEVPSIVLMSRVLDAQRYEWLMEKARRRPQSAVVRWHRPTLAEGGPYAGPGWRRQNRDAALYDAAPHVLSQLMPVLGSVDEIEVESRDGKVIAQLRHGNGSRSHVSMSMTTSPAEAEEYIEFAAPAWRDYRDTANYDWVQIYHHALDLLRGPQDALTVHPASLDAVLEYHCVIERMRQAADG